MSTADSFLRRFPRREAAPAAPATAAAGNAAPATRGTAAPAARPAARSAGPAGLSDLLSRPRPGRDEPAAAPPAASQAPSSAATPAPAADASSLLDLFGDATDSPPANRDPEPAPTRAAPMTAPEPATSTPATNAPVANAASMLDLFPDEPAAAPAPASPAPPPATASSAATAPSPATATTQPSSDERASALLDAFMTREAETAASPAPAEAAQLDEPWTVHFPQQHGAWRMDNLRPGSRVLLLDRVQSGTGYLEIAQPEGYGAPGLLQAVAQLSDGHVVSSQLGKRNLHPVVNASQTSLTVHLRLLQEFERFLVVFTPQQGADQHPMVRLTDDFSGGTLENHIAAPARHHAVFSGFVVDSRLVLRFEERAFSGSIAEPFTAFGYPLGSPQAHGLRDRA